MGDSSGVAFRAAGGFPARGDSERAYQCQGITHPLRVARKIHARLEHIEQKNKKSKKTKTIVYWYIEFICDIILGLLRENGRFNKCMSVHSVITAPCLVGSAWSNQSSCRELQAQRQSSHSRLHKQEALPPYVDDTPAATAVRVALL